MVTSYCEIPRELDHAGFLALLVVRQSAE